MKLFLKYFLLFVVAYLMIALIFGDPYYVVEKLGNGYFITHSSTNDRAIGKDIKGNSFTVPISGHITNLVNDKHFVLVGSVSRDSLGDEMNNSILLGKTWEEKDNILTNSTYKAYYIIDKENKKEYGRYNIENYQNKFQELMVPQNLKL